MYILVIIIEYCKKPCIIRRNLPLKGFSGSSLSILCFDDVKDAYF